MSLLSNSFWLYMVAKIKPEAWDAIIPHGPKVSIAARNVFSAMVIKSVARGIEDPELSYELDKLGKSLFEEGASGMSAGYDDDNWCGTIYPHWPIPGPRFDFESLMLGSAFGDEVGLNPQPLPPHGEKYLGGVLSIIAGAVSSKEISSKLNSISAQLLNTKERQSIAG